MRQNPNVGQQTMAESGGLTVPERYAGTGGQKRLLRRGARVLSKGDRGDSVEFAARRPRLCVRREPQTEKKQKANQ